MTARAIAAARLRHQRIVAPDHAAPADLVAHLGAVQAQDPAMVRWAVGLRLKQARVAAVDEALAAGTIIRTHVLRPTWHLVAAADLRWLLALTGPRIRRGLAGRLEELELPPRVVARGHDVFAKALSSGRALTRRDLAHALETAGLGADSSRVTFLLMTAELDGLICGGPPRDGHHTYALVDERVAAAAPLARDEALAKLAQRYFHSRGPATLADFAWWSGLTLTDARRGVAAAGGLALQPRLGVDLHGPAAPGGRGTTGGVHLLPAFDEYLIAYRDREAVLPPADHRRAVSSNGMFHPVIVAGGRVIGTWQRRVQGDEVRVAARCFAAAGRPTQAAIAKAARRYAAFLGGKAVVTVTAG